MSVSTESSTPVDYLLREVARLKAENKYLRRRIQWLKTSRAYWRSFVRSQRPR